MNSLQKRQLEILNETINYYGENPAERRCTNGHNGCFYSPEKAGKPNSEGCAVGRLLLPELKTKLDSNGSWVSDSSIWGELPEDVKKLSKPFLTDLQSLHDNPKNWGKTGLTKKGESVVNEIKIKFDLI